MSRVQSIERAFAVLGVLSDGPVGVTEVAERARLAKSTAARLLASLAREGAVEQVPGGSRYRLGPRLRALAAAAVAAPDVIAVARRPLENLAAAVGEAAGLSIPEGRFVRYVDQVSVTHEVQVRDWTGARAPMHAVSSGLVFLADLSPEALDAALAGPLQALTPRTVTDPGVLRGRLAAVRRDGHAWVREEFAEGLNSVAAPVVDPAGRVIAAVHVHGPSYRFPRRGRADEVAARVVASAGEVSRALSEAGVPA